MITHIPMSLGPLVTSLSTPVYDRILIGICFGSAGDAARGVGGGTVVFDPRPTVVFEELQPPDADDPGPGRTRDIGR